ncbi:MAG: hypothetical protein H7A51_04005 [Akkermansiaceae bacterium]|nr:hypothetical protein [Akkermansiaceae bacterium]
MNQLTGRGIPIIGELAKQFGVSDSQVKKLVESGKVGFPAIEQAFVSLTSEGGKFHGMMAAQSQTTTGLFSTLKDAINETFLILGQPINDALRPLIAEAIVLVQKLAPMAKRAGEAVKGAIQFVIAAFKERTDAQPHHHFLEARIHGSDQFAGEWISCSSQLPLECPHRWINVGQPRQALHRGRNQVLQQDPPGHGDGDQLHRSGHGMGWRSAGEATPQDSRNGEAAWIWCR